MSASAQVRTITDMVAEAPDVDVSQTWARLWEVLTELKERIEAELGPVTRHHSSADWDFYEVGGFEGSLHTHTGPQMEWFVHSWIGKREASILDMNVTVWLGPHIDAPHLSLVFGTVPHLYIYSDLLPRRDIYVDDDYLRRYYEPQNDQWLKLRGDDRLTWSVSHGTYMRAILTPVAYSYMTERTPEMVEEFAGHARQRVDAWLEMVRTARSVPVEEQAALRARDHQLRNLCYTLDPMNALAAKAMGQEVMEGFVERRRGALQQAEALT